MFNSSILVTGSAGFIGANFVRTWLANERDKVISLDKLTYAGNLEHLAGLDEEQHIFVQGDIGDAKLIGSILKKYRPRAIINFAAETHVDRSIQAPQDFIQTNVVGTFQMLRQAHAYWTEIEGADKNHFRFLNISTDEVYGSLGVTESASDETKSFAPNNPYAASKAASDHMVRAYHQTFGLPVLTTHCSNNYGPYQFPEKLIPLIILNALKGKPLPIYGDGKNIRDWLYVDDHCSALRIVLANGQVGETYNIGGRNEKTNLEVVHTICALLDEMRPQKNHKPYSSLISYVKDRPGHDRRYAIDADKIKKELGWMPQETDESGMRKTVQHYVGIFN